jgi:hypothetical protein
MAPELIAAIITALLRVGPGAVDAINDIVKAAHGHPLQGLDGKAIGDAILKAVANK